ncbi:MAG: hypothetical protein IPK15_16645 [Verrucomicrobia bacterium]|nr:hypothetical protein [Verrucomicrobiota bacterium]
MSNWWTAALSNEVRKRWETGAAAEHEHVQLMRREFEPATDAMFFFRLIEGKSYGYGWVILRRGEIHKKFVLEGSGAIWGKKP